ncbi:hypothetical protein [Caedibacter taeniospiralis]|uniref:Uncharacterized protein n=1 Tax=Caedibacter taeniospiralis TaxID=28907 RepID=Q6TFD5_CAETA|nr:hypothetical protein [Caedibacter taeniospiralis]AAR87124.1 hypothetical protein [Caedibacter taeniospiralis]
MFDQLKNIVLIFLTLILLILLPFTVYFGNSYFNLSAKIDEIQKNQGKLLQSGLTSDQQLNKALDKLSQTFLNNRYILNNQPTNEKLNVKTLCQQSNGIECVSETKNIKNME